jgi:hypothetical protein
MGLAGKGIAMWFVLLVAMFGNGMLRVFVLQPRLGADAARQVACLTGLVIVVALSGVFVRAIPGASSDQLLKVGAIWLLLTVTFEFLFGHFASGMSWSELLEDYDLLRGRLWALVLLGTVLAPWVWGMVLGRARR